MDPFRSVAATPAERAVPRPGDTLVAPADVVMDRAFTVPGAPDEVWPWVVQLGKGRAGWYLPPRLERVLPTRFRASNRLDPRWTTLTVGDVVPDYGRNATFDVAAIDAPNSLVYTSTRGRMRISWSIALEEQPLGTGATTTRVFLRLRLAPVGHLRLAESIGGLFDAATIAGMAAGLRARLAQPPHS